MLDYAPVKMLSVCSCIANMCGTQEKDIIVKTQQYMRGQLTIWDKKTDEFIQRAQESHALITLRSALADGNQKESIAGNSYKPEELFSPRVSEINKRLIHAFAAQFKREALTKRAQAAARSPEVASHLFDLPSSPLLMQVAPGIKSARFKSSCMMVAHYHAASYFKTVLASGSCGPRLIHKKYSATKRLVRFGPTSFETASAQKSLPTKPRQ